MSTEGALPEKRLFARSVARVAEYSRAHWLEATSLAAVLTVALLLRIVKLGTIPRILQGDEANTVEDALRIRAGTGPGIIAYDWAQSPLLATYPLAWIIDIFGDSMTDMRLYSVVFSMLTIVFLYILARESMGVLPALAAILLLATNVWYLNFSRTLWYNINAPFFAVAACWTVTRALRSGGRAHWAWWALTGLLVAASLYGYATGRFICISVAVVAAIAVATRVAPARRTIVGLVLAGLISAVLFAPMANFIFDHYDRFKTRADTVSVFNRRNPDGSKQNGWAIAWDSLEPNYRGLIFNDGQQAQRGPYNARYHPPYRAALTILGTHLFLVGVVLAAFQWRRTYTWFPFFIPAAIANIFSGDTPDYSRALPLAPFYFLFIGFTFEEALRRRWRFAPRPAIVLAIALATAFISVRDVRLYFDWQDNVDVQVQRMPGLDHCEYGDWLKLANESADQGGLVSAERFAVIRRQLECSPVVARQGGYDQAVIFRELTSPSCREQEQRSVAYLPDPGGLYALWGNTNKERALHIMYQDAPLIYNPDPSGGAGCVAFGLVGEPVVRARIEGWAQRRGAYEIRKLTDHTRTARIEAVVPRGDAAPGLDVSTLETTWRTRLDLGAGIEGIVRGQEKDVIRAIDTPSFVQTGTDPSPAEPVLLVELGGETRAYPLRLLIWHGVANDTIDGVPVAVTFDAIAGAGRVYDRRVGGRTLTFGVSGLLRGGNALLFDRETETWWQQLTGHGVTGEMHDALLTGIPSTTAVLGEVLRATPGAAVMVSPGTPGIRYELNPYLGYDAPGTKPLFSAYAADPRLPAMQRVAVIEANGRRFAVPYPPGAAPDGQALSRAYNLDLGGQRIALLFDARMASPLDFWSLAGSRRIGAFTAFRADSTQGLVSFDGVGRPEPTFVDPAAQSTFDVFGRRIDGMGTTQLQPAETVHGFWFSIAAAYPDIEIVKLDNAN